jgi:hypothetical protein
MYKRRFKKLAKINIETQDIGGHIRSSGSFITGSEGFLALIAIDMLSFFPFRGSLIKNDN